MYVPDEIRKGVAFTGYEDSGGKEWITRTIIKADQEVYGLYAITNALGLKYGI